MQLLHGYDALHILIWLCGNKSYFIHRRVDVRGLAGRGQLPDECGCRTPIRRGRQRCVEIIKPSDLWPFHEFARYLLGTSVSPRCIQFSFGYTTGSVSQNRWYSASLLLGSGHRPGKCRAQRSTFNSPRLSISIPDPFWRSPSHSDASSRPYLSFILLTPLSHPFTPPPPLALNLPLSTALLSGVAPSRVHPIPVFN